MGSDFESRICPICNRYAGSGEAPVERFEMLLHAVRGVEVRKPRWVNVGNRLMDLTRYVSFRLDGCYIYALAETHDDRLEIAFPYSAEARAAFEALSKELAAKDVPEKPGSALDRLIASMGPRPTAPPPPSSTGTPPPAPPGGTCAPSYVSHPDADKTTLLPSIPDGDCTRVLADD